MREEDSWSDEKKKEVLASLGRAIKSGRMQFDREKNKELIANVAKIKSLPDGDIDLSTVTPDVMMVAKMAWATTFFDEPDPKLN